MHRTATGACWPTPTRQMGGWSTKGYALTLTYPPNVRHVERIRAAVQEARAAGRGLHATSAFACTPKEYRAGKCR
jgi:hypothetical protein